VLLMPLKAMHPAEYQRLIGSDPILSGMIRHNIPLTRENYVDIANAGRPDDAWTAEHEAALPWIFREKATSPGFLMRPT
jgi:hypothetical protein